MSAARFTLGLMKDWGVALVLVLAVFVGWQLFATSGPAVGDAAPTFALPDTDGEMVNLADFTGETVVVNFWATWCGPCRSEIPDLNAFAEAHPEIHLLGVSVDEKMSASGVRATARRLGAEYTILLDPKGDASALYDVSTLPTTVVIGPDGNVVNLAIGTVDQRELERMVGL